MVGDKKMFFGTTQRTLKNAILGKKNFRAYNTHKSPLRNVFFFVHHKPSWDMEHKQTDWSWSDKSSKQHEISKNNIARYISSQVMFQQQDLFY